MGFSIWNLIKASLLVVNAFAVLHPQRFLRAHGLDGSPDAAGGDGVKHQLGVLFTAARMMRVPLLICNSVVVVVEVLFG